MTKIFFDFFEKLIFSIILTFLIFLTSCMNVKNTAGLEERIDILEQGSVSQMPLVAPSKSVTVLRDALSCMDQMLREEKIPTTLIAIKNIPDASGLFSTGTKDMLITSLSRMSRTSQAFRVVDYEMDALRQDTVQNMTSILLNAGLINIPRPAIYISGSISFGDKTVISKRKSMGISTNSTDTGYSWDVIGSTVGLDLHLGEMATRTLYAGLESSNEIVIGSGGKALEIGAKVSGLPKYIYRLGAQYESAFDNNQGAGAAIRILADLAMIELIGKWTRVPYWQCIEYEHNHPEFQHQMRQWYDEMSYSERIILAQRALAALGYWNTDFTDLETAQFRKTLMNYQASMDLVPSGMMNFETYRRLMKFYVRKDHEGKFNKIGWSPDLENHHLFSFGASHENEFNKENTTALPAIKNKEHFPEMNHQVVLNMLQNKKEINVGDPISFRVIPHRNGYLYCYYQDSLNKVSQIYPNPLQLAALIQGKRNVFIPNPLNPNTFLIEATHKGNEQALCLLSNINLKDILPAYLTKADLEPIEKIASLDEIKNTISGFEQLKNEILFSETINWKINEVQKDQTANINKDKDAAKNLTKDKNTNTNANNHDKNSKPIQASK